MIHMVPIKSLPQEWLWCETWCSEESKTKAKTIDLVSLLQYTILTHASQYVCVSHAAPCMCSNLACASAQIYTWKLTKGYIALSIFFGTKIRPNTEFLTEAGMGSEPKAIPSTGSHGLVTNLGWHRFTPECT